MINRTITLRIINIISLAHSRGLCWLPVLLLLTIGGSSYAQVPVIKEVTPNRTFSEQIINIKGNNFDSSPVVTFGSAKGTVISSSDQLIEVKVPAAATYDLVSVTNPNKLKGYSPRQFVLSFGGEYGISNSDFAAQFNQDASSGLYDLSIVDIDGDGLNDVISSSSKSVYANILRNGSTSGNLIFSPLSINVGFTTLNIIAGDLNGDNKPEVIFSEANDGNRIFILTNTSSPGSISFSSQSLSISGTSTKRIEINDLDLDGKPDLVITDQASNKVVVLRNTTSTAALNFAAPVYLNVPYAASTGGLVVKDLNDDGKPDIVVTQFNIDGGGIFMGENTSSPGTISFSSFHQKNFPGSLANLQSADFNNDGKADIIATRFLSSDVAVLINESSRGGALTFASPVSIPTDIRPWGLDIGDMDGDGKEDILVATVGSDLAVNILSNNSAGSLSFQKVRLPATYINRNIKSGDMDGDGKPDIIFASIDDDNNGIMSSKISIFRNNKCVKPILHPEGSKTICSGNSYQLETQLIAGATYEWRLNGTIEKTGTDNFIDVVNSGSYTVTLISGSCSEVSEPEEITVISGGALPSAEIEPVDPVCINATLTLSLVADVGATKYVWRGPEGFSETGNPVSLTGFQFSNTGKYYVDVYSGSCIVETKSIVVEAIDGPEFSISASSSGPFCDGDNVIITVTPDDPNYSYQWYNENGVISGATNAQYVATTSGKYYARLKDTANATCSGISIDTKEISVKFLSGPVADFSFPPTACTGQPVTFSDESVLDSEATADYTWTFGDGASSTLPNPEYVFQTAGTYTIKLKIKYQGLSCFDEMVKTLTVLPGLNVEVKASATAICSGEAVELSTTENFEAYTWSTQETTANISVDKGGTFSVVVKDSNGCEGTGNITLQAFPNPTVTASADPAIVAPGEEVQLYANGLNTFSWTPKNLLTNTTIADPVAIVHETTIFTVTGEDKNGCKGSASVEVHIGDNLIGSIIKPKNFFSPNDGDNINSMWMIEKIEQFPQCGVSVLDQTGNLLMEAKPYLNDWDGTARGKRLPSGVYYYIIKCSDDKIVKSGSITLLR